MYRAVGWKALRDGVPLDDEEAVARIASASRIDVTSAQVTIDGDDVTRAIRTPEIDRAAAAVARLPRCATSWSSGSASWAPAAGSSWKGATSAPWCFRDADVKIYLDASAEERARRRASDPAHTGGPAAVAEVATLLTERDELDRTRTRRRSTPPRTPSSSTPPGSRWRRWCAR